MKIDWQKFKGSKRERNQLIKERLGEVRSRLLTEAGGFAPEELTAEKKEERKGKARIDREFFKRTYLGHYFSLESFYAHGEVEALLESGLSEYYPIAMPRGTGKSTTFNLADCVRDICLGLKHYLIICSDTLDQAVEHLACIQLELECNARLREDFGDLKGSGDWSKEAFVTANDVKVMALGRGQKIRGRRHRQWRPDKVILDDIENNETIRSPKQTKKIIKWITEEVIPALGANGVILHIGNLLSQRSALAHFLKHELFADFARVYDVQDDAGHSLWPARWSDDDLARKRRLMGTLSYNKEMRNKPEDEDGIIQRAWIRRYAPEGPDFLESKKWFKVFAGGDPNQKGVDGMDYAAWAVVGFDPRSGKIYVLYAWIRKDSVAAMIKTAYRLHQDFNVLSFALEVNLAKDLMEYPIAAERKRQGYPLAIRRVENMVNKETRIESLAPLIEYGDLLFPSEGGGDIELLIDQLVHVGTGEMNDDGPDALEMAVRQGMGLIRARDWRAMREEGGGAAGTGGKMESLEVAANY